MQLHPFITALEIAEAIRSRSLSILEVVDYFLGRIEQHGVNLNAITYVDPEAVRTQAVKMQAHIDSDPSRPLHLAGVPIAVKALTSVAGWPATLCSSALKGNVATESHDLVKQLMNAGLIPLCQTTSPELGSVPVTESALHGITRNPWNPHYTPGGSSGGSAAAVASGIVPIAEASDGGGSIRIPASCCGLVGLKPSRGRLPVGPFMADSVITTKGFITRTVRDTAALLDQTICTDPSQWNILSPPNGSFLSLLSPSPSKLRIGFTVESPLGGQVDRECQDAVNKVALALEELGHSVFEKAPNWKPADEFVHNFILLWAAHMGDLELPDPSLLEPHNLYLWKLARSTPCNEYRLALQKLQKISRELVSIWNADIDLLVTPTIARTPPPIGSILDGSAEDPGAPIHKCFDLVPFTPWFNVTGQPAISIPAHESLEGLPVGVQIVGPPRNDLLVLQVAQQLEEILQWPHCPENRFL